MILGLLIRLVAGTVSFNRVRIVPAFCLMI